MLRFVILSLALVALINSLNIPRTVATPPGIYHNEKTFVKIACNSTKYPTMCYDALSSYSSIIKSDPIKLCLTSLSVNLKSAKNASSIVFSLLKRVKAASSPEVRNLKVCLEKIKHNLDDFTNLVIEILNITSVRRISGNEVKTKFEKWVRSGSTDVRPCMNMFDKRKENGEMEKVKKAVAELSMTTSNTLALITRESHGWRA